MSAHDTTPGLQRRLGRVDDLAAAQALRDAQHLRLRVGVRGLEQNGSVATLYHHIWSACSTETVGKIPIPFSYLYFLNENGNIRNRNERTYTVSWKQTKPVRIILETVGNR
jgi:hypothetical protein